MTNKNNESLKKPKKCKVVIWAAQRKVGIRIDIGRLMMTVQNFAEDLTIERNLQRQPEKTL